MLFQPSPNTQPAALNGIDLGRCPFNPASQDVTPGDASMTSHARSVTA